MPTKTDLTDVKEAGAPVRWADIHALRVGDTASCRLVVGDEEVDAFARLSGDVNPLHMEAGVCRDYGFPRRMAHGMLAVSTISRLIGTKLPGPGAMCLSLDIQYAAPVLVGDVLETRLTVERISIASETAKLRADVINTATSTSVLVGSAKVKVLRRSSQAQPPTPDERVAVVTGSSRGLGRAIARQLGASGIKVLVHYHERGDDAAAAVQEITSQGGKAIACQADLGDAHAYERLFQRACDEYGKVDILVSNATPPIVRKAALESEWADFQTYLNVYVRASFELAKLVAPGMQERRFGRIVNILAASAQGVPPPRLAAYVTAKSALGGLSRALAVELGPFGITVNMVAPSILLTDQAGGLGDRARQLAASQAPLRRLGAVDEVAGAVAFLVSDAASYVTGAVIPVAGGDIM